MQHFTKFFGEVCWSWHLDGVNKCHIKRNKLKMVKSSDVPLLLKIHVFAYELSNCCFPRKTFSEDTLLLILLRLTLC